MDSDKDTKPAHRGRCTAGVICRVALGLTLVSIIVLAVVFRRQLNQQFSNFLNWVRTNPAAGFFALIFVVVLFTVAALPGVIPTIGAGVVYAAALNNVGLGIAVGSLAVFVGATVGCIVSFLLARTVLRSCIERSLSKYPVFKAVDGLLRDQGFRLVFLLRLSPLIPFNVFNYGMGVTGISARSYSLASVGLLPGTIAYVALGATIQNAANANATSNPAVLSLTIIGTVIAIAVSIYFAKVSRDRVKAILASQKKEPAAVADDFETFDRKYSNSLLSHQEIIQRVKSESTTDPNNASGIVDDFLLDPMDPANFPKLGLAPLYDPNPVALVNAVRRSLSQKKTSISVKKGSIPVKKDSLW